MSGYLQRLAVSVARPRPSLHPLVGSIFSGERQEMAGRALMQSDALVSSDDQNLVPTTRTVSDSPDDPMRRSDLAADDRVEQHAGITLPTDDRRTKQRRSEREIFHPLLPNKTLEVDVSAMLPETVSEDVASPRSASIWSQRDRHDTSIVGAAPMAHVTVEDGPTADRRNMIAPPPVSGLREHAGMLAAVAGDAGKSARAEFSAPSRRSAQSDDIQIHIGRIEVTAVAQPTPRPVAAPARKAMSLGEYLGRRSRGTR
jgi:hypothetical protein